LIEIAPPRQLNRWVALPAKGEGRMTESKKKTIATVVGLICGVILTVGVSTVEGDPTHKFVTGIFVTGIKAGVLGSFVGYILARIVLAFFPTS
jgi:threonine/homoserine efflux transporter RhtA